MANHPPLTTTVLPHVKIAWGGSIGDPKAEVWANSLAWAPKDLDMSGVISDGLAREQANILGLATAIQQWFQTPTTFQGQDRTLKGAGVSPMAKLEWVKLNAVGADGKYLFPSNTYFFPAKISGGGVHVDNSGAYRPPWQMTTAITLRTTVARGRGSKGRIYPPLAGGPPDTDAEPYQAEYLVNQMANSFTGLLDNINAGLYMAGSTGSGGYEPSGGFPNSHPGNCVIASVSPHTGPHAGAAPLLTPILKVEVDRTADVQTRRVDRIPRSITGQQLITLNL